jgi:hypothetical protein
MDLLTLFIGLLIGLIVGFAIAWFWANSLAESKISTIQNPEEELKALFALQASSHLQTSKEAIQSIEHDLASLRNNVAEYEKLLTDNTQDYSKTTFFGEHTSMFLRNAESKSNKSIRSEHPDNQPKDFANSGSGVFRGSSTAQSVKIEEKSNN